MIMSRFPGNKRAKKDPPEGGPFWVGLSGFGQELLGHRQAGTPEDALRHQLLPAA